MLKQITPFINWEIKRKHLISYKKHSLNLLKMSRFVVINFLSSMSYKTRSLRFQIFTGEKSYSHDSTSMNYAKKEESKILFTGLNLWVCLWALSEQHPTDGVFIVTESRSFQFATIVGLVQVGFGRRREVPHDHSGWVDRHHKVSGVFQGASLLSEDINDLGEKTALRPPQSSS